MSQSLLATLTAFVTIQFPEPTSQQERVSISKLDNLQRCSVNRLLPDPTSRRIVIWDKPRDLRVSHSRLTPKGFMLAELPPEGSDAGKIRAFSGFGSNVRVDPVRWSRDGKRLLLRDGRTGLQTYYVADARLERRPELDPLWTDVRVEAITHSSEDFFYRPETVALLKQIWRDGSPLRITATTGSASTAFLVFRLGHRFRFTGYQDRARWDTEIPISFASSPLVLPDRKLQFLGNQTGYSEFLPYALPVIDRVSGQVIGRFGWERIEFGDGRAIDLKPYFSQLMTIKDVSANGNTLFALVDLEREMRVVRIRDGQVKNWLLCEKEPLQIGSRNVMFEQTLPAETPVVRSEIRFRRPRESDKAMPFGFLYRPVRAGNKLVVYFHGGPTSTLAEETVSDVVAKFADHGVSVLAVEYSGSLGGGLPLSERLPRLGLRALQDDVELITTWVTSNEFHQAYILADSFGGVPAVVAASKHSGTYERLFLRAPMLALRAPEQSVRRNNFFGGQVPPVSQLESEYNVYGGADGRSRFDKDLQTYVQSLRPSHKLNFYFGTLDPVSSVTDLPDAFSRHSSVMSIRARHEDVGSSDAVWGDILNKMGLLEEKMRIGATAPDTQVGASRPDRQH